MQSNAVQVTANRRVALGGMQVAILCRLVTELKAIIGNYPDGSTFERTYCQS